MLKRKFRLSRKSFASFSKTLNGKYFNIKSKKNDLLYNRFSVVVSKRIDKKAIERNRIRRMINEFVYNNLNEFDQGYDILIIVKPEINDKNKNEIFSKLSKYMASPELYK